MNCEVNKYFKKGYQFKISGSGCLEMGVNICARRYLPDHESEKKGIKMLIFTCLS
jgi:hypothetical protein